jgi:hypothetical protein
MASQFDSVFVRLRGILKRHAESLSVSEDAPTRFCLEGRPGPATLQAWGGKMKRPTLPVAWVQIGRSYVSYHLMALDGDTDGREALSKELRARMQGKTCFNFQMIDEPLFRELEALTARECHVFRKAGFIQ